MLASRWGWAHISVGHELRRYTQQCDQEDDTISQSVRSATLVPVRQLAEVLARRMQSLWDEGHVSFIIDGFPRHESQISYIQDTVSHTLSMDLSNKCADRCAQSSGPS